MEKNSGLLVYMTARVDRHHFRVKNSNLHSTRVGRPSAGHREGVCLEFENQVSKLLTWPAKMAPTNFDETLL